MDIVLIIILSYLIGCFSSAYLIGRIFKKMDIRSYGSGNSGTTNAVRVMGFKLGVLTFLLDFSKGILAVLIGINIMGQLGGFIATIFVVIGHDWPVFLRFKGGKGIATTIGALAVLNFPVALISVIIGILTALLTRYVSLGSMMFLIMVPIISLIYNSAFNQSFFLTTVILGLVGIYRHKENIKRLINGNENKLGR